MTSHADRLRQERASVATGQLTLDREKARQKLQLFRLPSPYQYVLQFVRAASVLGATRISFDLTASALKCDFDAVFDGELLRDVWSPMFDERSSNQQEAVRNLALGISSAQGLNPRLIEVRSNHARLTVRGEEEEVEEVAEPADGTKILIEKKFHFGQVVDFFHSLFDRLPEEHELLRLCRFALMDIFVNGENVSHEFRRHWVRSMTEHGEAKVAASATLKDTLLVLLRDDVQVARLVRPRHVVGITAVLNSRSVVTDLSGLALQRPPDAEWDALTTVIHRAVHEWIQIKKHEVRYDELREELERVASFLVQRDAVMAPATKTLVDWLLDQPLFRSAVVGTDLWMKLQQPADGEPVRHASMRLLAPDMTDVLFLRKGSWIPKLLERAQIPTLDVTTELEVAAVRARNRTRWLNQPADVEHEFTEWREREVVRDGSLRGAVQIARGRGKGRIVWQKRLLQLTSSKLPFDYVIEGDADDLTANEHFDRVAPDERFDRLALALLRKTTELFDRVPIHERIGLLEAVVRRTFEIDVLLALGYEHGAALELLSQANLRADDPFGLELAGPLATLKLFDKRYSLIQLIEAENAPVFISPHHPLHLEPGRIKLILTPAEKRIVKFVRPDAGEIDETLANERARESFERQSTYVVDPALQPVFRRVVRGRQFELELLLLGDEGEQTSTVIFVYEGRRLAREQWSSELGAWHVVVRCDHVQPHWSYVGVMIDDIYQAIRQAVTKQQESALNEWMEERLAAGVVAPELARLFATLAVQLPIEQVKLPVRKFDGTNWSRGLATLNELRSAATRGGGTAQWISATEDTVGLFIAGDLVLEVEPIILERKRLLRDVNFASGNFALVSASRAQYTNTAPRRNTLQDALYEWFSNTDGFDVHVGLYAGDPRLDVEFLWLDRVLERSSFEAPGRFVAVVMGSAIEANESLTAVSEGKDAALEAVQVGIKQLIEAACFQIKERQFGYLSRGMNRVREELLGIASRASGDEPWWIELEAAPLIETSSGRQSLRDQRELDPDPAPELLGRVAQVLDVARDGRSELLADFTLGSLRSADRVQKPLCRASGHGVTVREDHPLVTLAAQAGEVGVAFLASCVYTQINAYYAEISDTDEIAFQQSLLRVVE